MTHPLIIIGAGIAGLWTALQAAPPAPAQQPLTAIAPLSVTCPDDLEGEGAARESAINVSVDELFAEAEWAASEGTLSDYNCRWVRVRGHFRWADYWHYEGRLYGGPLEVYSDRPHSVWIESFADPDLRRAGIEGFELDVLARHYDLCAMHAEVRSADEWIFGGPCHHDGLNGLMLADAEVVARVSTGSQRVRGEINRAPIGDLLRVENEALAQLLRLASQEWVARTRPTTQSPPTVSRLAETEAAEPGVGRRENPDTWLRLLGDADLSPFNRLSDPEMAPFAAFVSRQEAAYSEDVGDGVAEAYGCYCLSADCEDQWPLFAADTRRMTDDYVCTLLQRADNVWSAAP